MEQMTRAQRIAELFYEKMSLEAVVSGTPIHKVTFTFGFPEDVVFTLNTPLFTAIIDAAELRLSKVKQELDELLQNK